MNDKILLKIDSHDLNFSKVLRPNSLLLKILVKGRSFGSPLARGMTPRASTAPDSTGKPVASSAVKLIHMVKASAFAAQMKSFSEIPPIAWVA